jgi:hypothetical protein
MHSYLIFVTGNLETGNKKDRFKTPGQPSKIQCKSEPGDYLTDTKWLRNQRKQDPKDVQLEDNRDSMILSNSW